MRDSIDALNRARNSIVEMVANGEDRITSLIREALESRQNADKVDNIRKMWEDKVADHKARIVEIDKDIKLLDNAS